MSSVKASTAWRVASVAIGLLLLASTAWVLFNRQYTLDLLSVWQYEPSLETASIAEETTMTELGKFYFYASHPQLLPSDKFNNRCHRHEPGSAVLGCYSAGRIYIYDVSDERLDGVKQVTAAHEMLHAVYMRMSQSERDRVGALLEAEYKAMNDQRLDDRMSYYERAQPGERVNELHSIIGTEYRDLSDELEAHYAKYFLSRSEVVDLFENYNQLFIELNERLHGVQQEIESLSAQIDAARVEYRQELQQLNAAIVDFNTRAARGDFDSPAQFSIERSQLVNRSNHLAAMQSRVNALVTQHNELVVELERLSGETRELQRSLDSNPPHIPSV